MLQTVSVTFHCLLRHIEVLPYGDAIEYVSKKAYEEYGGNLKRENILAVQFTYQNICTYLFYVGETTQVVNTRGPIQGARQDISHKHAATNTSVGNHRQLEGESPLDKCVYIYI